MNLYCPYCNNGIEIEQSWDDNLTIVCEAYSDCGAEWSFYGEVIREGADPQATEQ